MDGLIIISILLLGGLAIAAAKKNSVDGMSDKPVSINNIRMGVERGWYTATLCIVQGIPAIRLTGKDASGKTYSDVYPISEQDWETLKAEGYNVEKV